MWFGLKIATLEFYQLEHFQNLQPTPKSSPNSNSPKTQKPKTVYKKSKEPGIVKVFVILIPFCFSHRKNPNRQEIPLYHKIHAYHHRVVRIRSVESPAMVPFVLAYASTLDVRRTVVPNVPSIRSAPRKGHVSIIVVWIPVLVRAATMPNVMLAIMYRCVCVRMALLEIHFRVVIS